MKLSIRQNYVYPLIPILSVIGNVSKSSGIILPNGENDSQTPVQLAFLLQQGLTEVNHPDHILIAYPNLGHVFYASSRLLTGIEPLAQYILADLYTWLETRSRFTNPAAAVHISTTSIRALNSITK